MRLKLCAIPNAGNQERKKQEKSLDELALLFFKWGRFFLISSFKRSNNAMWYLLLMVWPISR
jgi:hypothetical protein